MTMTSMRRQRAGALATALLVLVTLLGGAVCTRANG